jgi:hypothetical protein
MGIVARANTDVEGNCQFRIAPFNLIASKICR